MRHSVNRDGLVQDVLTVPKQVQMQSHGSGPSGSGM